MEIDTGKIINATLMIGALGYFILPLDIVSDFLGPLGYIDDGAALTFAFERGQALFSGTSIEAAMKKTESIMGKDFDRDKVAKLLKNRKKQF